MDPKLPDMEKYVGLYPAQIEGCDDFGRVPKRIFYAA